jgi:hypothetical protein
MGETFVIDALYGVGSIQTRSRRNEEQLSGLREVLQQFLMERFKRNQNPTDEELQRYMQVCGLAVSLSLWPIVSISL